MIPITNRNRKVASKIVPNIKTKGTTTKKYDNLI